MGSEIAFSDAIVETAIALAPSFLTLIFCFILLAWLRVLVEAMSPRGWF